MWNRWNVQDVCWYRFEIERMFNFLLLLLIFQSRSNLWTKTFIIIFIIRILIIIASIVFCASSRVWLISAISWNCVFYPISISSCSLDIPLYSTFVFFFFLNQSHISWFVLIIFFIYLYLFLCSSHYSFTKLMTIQNAKSF